MKTARSMSVWLFLILLVTGTAAFAQTVPVELEVGYRFTDVEGNEDLYRTQINEDEGFLLRSLTMFTTDFNGGMLDHFRLDVSDLGTSPAGSLRLEAGKSELYNLRLGYRNADAFSALPAFANPLLGRGIIPGQHTYDRTRTMIDADLEFLPGRAITPFVGYTHNTYDGPGSTTYSLGLDEFRLLSDFEESEDEFRVGAGFRFNRVYGQITQGWRSLSSDETLTLAAGEGSGNNLGAVLGRPVTADHITRSSETDVDTPFTNLFVTGELTSRIKLVGNYSRFTAESEGTEDESSSGSFISFALGRFFGGLEESVSSKAENESWRGGLRAEIALTDRIDFLAGVSTDNRELEGSSLINSLYLDTVTFAGVDPRDIAEILETENGLEREDQTIHAAVSARAIGPLAVRVGYRQTKQDITVAPDLEEIVVPGNQGGEFERTIDTIDASATFNMGGFLFGAAARFDDSDDPILRTDFMNRDRVRVRSAYQTPGNMFRIGLTAEQTNQENDQEGRDYRFDGDMQQLSADFEFAPIAAIRFRGSYSILDAESDIAIRRPENFEIINSHHEENGDAIEGGVSVFYKRFSFDGDFAQFENEGSLPFTIDRLRLRLGVDLIKNTGFVAEWANDDYDENDAWGNYEADRFGLFLRWRP
jgi:hypothetical protein